MLELIQPKTIVFHRTLLKHYYEQGSSIMNPYYPFLKQAMVVFNPSQVSQGKGSMPSAFLIFALEET